MLYIVGCEKCDIVDSPKVDTQSTREKFQITWVQTNRSLNNQEGV